MVTQYRLIWHLVTEEGFRWYLRGILNDGRFYGDVRFQSDDPALRRACAVDGQLSPEDFDRFIALCSVLTFAGMPPTASYAILISVDGGKDAGVFRYDRGDEEASSQARSFLEIKRLLNPYIDLCWNRYYPHDGLQRGLGGGGDKP